MPKARKPLRLIVATMALTSTGITATTASFALFEPARNSGCGRKNSGHDRQRTGVCVADAGAAEVVESPAVLQR